MNTKKIADGREIAQENEETVLLALAEFGWLVTRQINAFGWPNSKNPGAAHRTLRRLRENKEIVWERGNDGSVAYALSAKGAKRFLDIFSAGLIAVPTKGILRYIGRNFQHRALANDVCIWWRNHATGKNREYSTEHDIVTRRAIIGNKAPDFCSNSGKIPDSVLYCDDTKTKPLGGETIRSATWVEVEFAHKNKEKQKHLVKELASIIGRGNPMETLVHPTSGGAVRYIVHEALVACPNETLEARLLSFLEAYLLSNATEVQEIRREYVLNHLKLWRLEPKKGQAKVESVAQAIWNNPDWQAHARKSGLMWRGPQADVTR